MIAFVNDGKYKYLYSHYEIILVKEKKKIIINIFHKTEHKHYRMQLSEIELNEDEYFQSIKTEYPTLELFGLSNVELFAILFDNALKKKKYSIAWYQINVLNIREDTIKMKIDATPNIELNFDLEFISYS